MWGDIAIAFLLAFVTSFILVPYTIKWAEKLGAIDIPNERKVHKTPIARIGGVAVVIGFIVSVLYLLISMKIEKANLDELINYKIKIIGFFIGILIISLFGLLDDIKNLKPWQKLLVQVIAANIIYLFGIKIDSINTYMIPEYLNYILTIGWIVGITNAIDLIDGLDGLSSGVTLISSISLMIIFATNNTSPLISIIFITALAGAITGFLPYNVNPAKTFIGDVGAQFLGFALAVITIIGVAKTVTLVVIIAPVLVLGLPIFDTLYAIFRRIKNGKSLKSIFKADKKHIHHKLMEKGYTQKQAVTLLYFASSILGMFAIILIEDGIMKAVSFLIVIVVIIVLGYKELKEYNEKILKENKNKKG